MADLAAVNVFTRAIEHGSIALAKGSHGLEEARTASYLAEAGVDLAGSRLAPSMVERLLADVSGVRNAGHQAYVQISGPVTSLLNDVIAAIGHLGG